MATLRNKRRSAASNRDNHEDHLRNNQARNANCLRIQDGYINQVSDEIEGKVTKKNCLRSAVGRKVAFWVRYQD